MGAVLEYIATEMLEGAGNLVQLEESQVQFVQFSVPTLVALSTFVMNKYQYVLIFKYVQQKLFESESAVKEPCNEISANRSPKKVITPLHLQAAVLRDQELSALVSSVRGDSSSSSHTSQKSDASSEREEDKDIINSDELNSEADSSSNDESDSDKSTVDHSMPQRKTAAHPSCSSSKRRKPENEHGRC